MRLRVLFFSLLQDRFGAEELLEQFPGRTVSDLLQYYRVIAPELAGMWDVVAVAVNQRYTSKSTLLMDGDEVALLPPVSGGTSEGRERTDRSMRVELVFERIDATAITAGIKAGEDGAVTIFDGIVRNNSRGRQTLYLDYTAYEAMALEQMKALAQEAKTRFAIRDVAMVHRLGRLEIGETSILIAVASAHRGATFEACRWLIDTLKKQVPIWKREVFVDGLVWAPGEPFPAEIVPAVDSDV